MHLNRVKQALKEKKPTARLGSGTGPQSGQEARQHSRAGGCQPLVTPSPPYYPCSCFCHSPGGFPKLSTGQSPAGQGRDSRMLKSVPWEQGCYHHTHLASSFAGNSKTPRKETAAAQGEASGQEESSLLWDCLYSAVKCDMSMQN